MLPKKPSKPAFMAATMFFRKPTGSFLMSSMAAVALAMMLPSSSDGKFISSQDQRDDHLDDDADELDDPVQRLAERRDDAVERPDRRQQALEATPCSRCPGTSR